MQFYDNCKPFYTSFRSDDATIVGKPIEQIGSIAIEYYTIFRLFLFGFFRIGTTGLVAQAWGKKDLKEIERILLNNLILALFVSFLCIMIIILLHEFILLLFTNDEIIKNYSSNYLLIRIFEAPAKFINFIILGLLLGCNKPWQVFKLVIFVNLLNIILDIILGVFLKYELSGIAFGTLIAEYCCLVLGMFITYKEFKNLQIIKNKIELKKLKNIFHSNLNLFVRTLLILIV